MLDASCWHVRTLRHWPPSLETSGSPHPEHLAEPWRTMRWPPRTTSPATARLEVVTAAGELVCSVGRQERTSAHGSAGFLPGESTESSFTMALPTTSARESRISMSRVCNELKPKDTRVPRSSHRGTSVTAALGTTHGPQVAHRPNLALTFTEWGWKTTPRVGV